MKKMTTGLLTAALTLMTTGIMAQENGNRDANNKIVRGPYETNRFFDNIFIGVAGGVNLYHGENDSYGKFGERLAPALDVHVGKWFTPSVGARIGYNGIQAKGWTDLQYGMYAKDADGSMFKEKFGVSYLHADFMWNFSNAVSGYKQTRTWNFVPFVGAGWVRSYGNSTFQNEFGLSVGLLNNIRLCNLLDLTIEARHLFVNERLDGVVRGGKSEGMTSLTMGLTFKINRRNFKRVQPPVAPDYSQYIQRIKALEGDNANLAGKNKNLSDENETLRNRQPETVTIAGANTETVKASPVALFFGLGKATLDKKELANLDFYVKNAISADKNKTFTLIGSADSATGGKEINQKLSEKRMQYVYELLTNKYGVPSERLVKKAEGDTNNRFSDPELNRTVILE